MLGGILGNPAGALAGMEALHGAKLLGIRALVGSRVGFRLDYRALRITDDPVEGYTEHQVSLGLSIFFRNPAE